MESSCYFTSSRGLLKSCGMRNALPVSSSASIDADLLRNCDHANTIYLCTDSISNFSDNYLHKIVNSFKLVTGDSDTTIHNEFLAQKFARKILEHPKLITWYAQNLVCTHPKLVQIPIGMDYHTMWERPGAWGLTRQSPIAQERTLINTFANAPNFVERLFAGYCNWHFAIERGDRRSCLERIDKSICLIEASHLPRISTWQRQAECMFVISPEGAGIDCHRTWEAILLGCVPVLKRNGISDLFNQLPVVILNDWSEFNHTNMLQHVHRLQQEKFNFNSLFAAYWQAKFLGENDFNLPEMTMKEFKNFVCGNSF